MKNKSTFVSFHQSSENLKDVLQRSNPKLLADLQQWRDAEPNKSVESKSGKLPEHAHYAIVGVLKGYLHLIEKAKTYGRSLLTLGAKIHSISIQEDEFFAEKFGLIHKHFVTIEKAKEGQDSEYAYFLVCGRNVLTFYNYLLNQVLE